MIQRADCHALMKHITSFPIGFMSSGVNYLGENICLPHKASKSNLMCNFYKIAAVGQLNKKVTKSYNTSFSLPQMYAEYLLLHTSLGYKSGTLKQSRSQETGNLVLLQMKNQDKKISRWESLVLGTRHRINSWSTSGFRCATLLFHTYQALR